MLYFEKLSTLIQRRQVLFVNNILTLLRHEAPLPAENCFFLCWDIVSQLLHINYNLSALIHPTSFYDL